MLTNICLKAYMFACSFDTWTRDLTSLSFVLIVWSLGFLLPLTVIIHSYISIVKFFKRCNSELLAFQVKSCLRQNQIIFFVYK